MAQYSTSIPTITVDSSIVIISYYYLHSYYYHHHHCMLTQGKIKKDNIVFIVLVEI